MTYNRTDAPRTEGGVSPVRTQTETYYTTPDAPSPYFLERVRWSAVLAGIVTVLATLIVLTVLGIAIGLSTFDASEADAFGTSAGIWGAVSGLIAYLLGGVVAGRTGGVALRADDGTIRNNGLLHGGLVWMVTLVLVVNVLGTGLGSIINVAGGVVSTAATAASNVAAGAAQNPEVVATAAGAVGDTAAGAEGTAEPGVAGTINEAVASAQEQIAQIDEQDVENVARDASNAAWAALLVLGLTAAAALLGGMLGGRALPERHTTTNTTASARRS
jgi:hypothetical protein